MFFLFGIFHSTWCSWNMEVLLWTMDMFALLSSLFHIPRAERPYAYFCWWTSKYETKQDFVYPRLVSNTRCRQGGPWTWDPPVSVFQGIDPWGFGRLGKLYQQSYNHSLFCWSLSGISILTPLRVEGKRYHWWTTEDSSWKACMPGPICILILYSKTTRWGRQASQTS